MPTVAVMPKAATPMVRLFQNTPTASDPRGLPRLLLIEAYEKRVPETIVETPYEAAFFAASFNGQHKSSGRPTPRGNGTVYGSRTISGKSCRIQRDPA
jgi:hypothetical protein